MSKPKSTAPAASTPAARGSRRLQTSRPGPSRTQILPPFPQLMANPSEADTESAQRPDFNPTPSVVWREKGAFSVTTNADGNFSVDILASLKNFRYTATFTGGTTVVASAAGTDIDNYTELNSSFGSYRPYIVEAEIEYIGEAQLAKGVIGTAVTSTLLNSGDLATLYDEPSYKETGTTQKAAARVFFVDNADFIAGSAASYGGTDPVEVIHFCGSGLPASLPCLRVRWTLVFEGIVGHTHLLSRSASHSISHPAQIAAVANIVGHKTRTQTGENPIQSLTKFATKAATIGAQLNGLYSASRPVLSLMGDFATLVA